MGVTAPGDDVSTATKGITNATVHYKVIVAVVWAEVIVAAVRSVSGLGPHCCNSVLEVRHRSTLFQQCDPKWPWSTLFQQCDPKWPWSTLFQQCDPKWPRSTLFQQWSKMTSVHIIPAVWSKMTSVHIVPAVWSKMTSVHIFPAV
jgi:hypothetical protein